MNPKSFEAPPFVVWRIVKKKEDSALPFSRRAHESSQHDAHDLCRRDLTRHDSDRNHLDLEGSEFRLVPHAVFREILWHGAYQWAALSFVFLYYLVSVPKIFRWPSWCAETPSIGPAACGTALSIAALMIFTCLAIYANIRVMMILNARPMQTTKALLQLCPENSRGDYEEWFPSIVDSRYRIIRRLRVTFQTLCFFLFGHRQNRKITQPLHRRALIALLVHFARHTDRALARVASFCRRLYYSSNWPRKHVVRLPATLSRDRRIASARRSYAKRATDWRLNFAKLGSLSLRREDSRLHAFSAFAAATAFVPHRRRRSVIPRIHINFILGYFSPIGFGFVLCMFSFVVFVIATKWAHDAHHHETLSRFPLMVGILVWLAQGLWYVKFTLRQEFASLFRNYFDTRIFPKSMTAFANAQIADAPHLASEVQGRWLNFLIVGLLIGLVSLYAALLHSLA